MDDPETAICALELRPRSRHGTTRVGGLSGIHHFCFATFQRPDRLEWGALRALNEYRLEPGAIRPPTFHAGFDIVTMVTCGALRRLGTFAPKQLLTRGSAELVSTGRGVDLGVQAVGEDPTTYVEIWIRTGPGLREPRRQWLASVAADFGRPLAAGPGAVAGSLELRAEASITRATLARRGHAVLQVEDGECAYLVVRSGTITGDGIAASNGDAFAATGPCQLTLEAEQLAELLLVRTGLTGRAGATLGA